MLLLIKDSHPFEDNYSYLVLIIATNLFMNGDANDKPSPSSSVIFSVVFFPPTHLTPLLTTLLLS